MAAVHDEDAALSEVFLEHPGAYKLNQVASSRFTVRWPRQHVRGLSRRVDDDEGVCPVDKDGDLVLLRAPAFKHIKLRHSFATPLHAVGLQVWNGACVLADWLLSQQQELPGTCFVELGAGVGLPSIVAGMLGARGFASDAPPQVLELLSNNLQSAGIDGAVKARHVDWMTFSAVQHNGNNAGLVPGPHGNSGCLEQRPVVQLQVAHDRGAGEQHIERLAASNGGEEERTERPPTVYMGEEEYIGQPVASPAGEEERTERPPTVCMEEEECIEQPAIASLAGGEEHVERPAAACVKEEEDIEQSAASLAGEELYGSGTTAALYEQANCKKRKIMPFSGHGIPVQYVHTTTPSWDRNELRPGDNYDPISKLCKASLLHGMGPYGWGSEDISLLSQVSLFLAADVVYDEPLTDAFCACLHALMRRAALAGRTQQPHCLNQQHTQQLCCCQYHQHYNHEHPQQPHSHNCEHTQQPHSHSCEHTQQPHSHSCEHTQQPHSHNCEHTQQPHSHSCEHTQQPHSHSCEHTQQPHSHNCEHTQQPHSHSCEHTQQPHFHSCKHTQQPHSHSCEHTQQPHCCHNHQLHNHKHTHSPHLSNHSACKPHVGPSSAQQYCGPRAIVAIEKRFNFTLRDMDARALAYDHFMTYIIRLEESKKIQRESHTSCVHMPLSERHNLVPNAESITESITDTAGGGREPAGVIQQRKQNTTPSSQQTPLLSCNAAGASCAPTCEQGKQNTPSSSHLALISSANTIAAGREQTQRSGYPHFGPDPADLPPQQGRDANAGSSSGFPPSRPASPDCLQFFGRPVDLDTIPQCVEGYKRSKDLEVWELRLEPFG